jgi:hypothetical protein
MWLSLVEHSVRDAGVGGSNPLIPTILKIFDNIWYIIHDAFQALVSFVRAFFVFYNINFISAP